MDRLNKHIFHFIGLRNESLRIWILKLTQEEYRESEEVFLLTVLAVRLYACWDCSTELQAVEVSEERASEVFSTVAVEVEMDFSVVPSSVSADMLSEHALDSSEMCASDWCVSRAAAGDAARLCVLSLTACVAETAGMNTLKSSFKSWLEELLSLKTIRQDCRLQHFYSQKWINQVTFTFTLGNFVLTIIVPTSMEVSKLSNRSSKTTTKYIPDV